MLLNRKWPLILIGSAVLLYSIGVLCFLMTTPDVGLRVLLPEEAEGHSNEEGIPIHVAPHLIAEEDRAAPETGDRLIRLGDLPIHNVLDFACQLVWLRNEKIEGGPLQPGESPSAEVVSTFGLSTLLKESEGKRWVEIEFYRPATQETHKTYLWVQSLPLGEVCLSFLWFSLQLAFFLVSAFLCWSRPYDRAARVLFGLGIVALGAFIAGNHWWVMSAYVWLIVPCAVCGILLPAVFLHFCLVFPRPKPVLQAFPRLCLLGVYVLPCLAVIVTLVIVIETSQLHDPGDRSHQAELGPILRGLRYGIYSYFGVAATYFLLALVAIWHSLQNAQQSKERQQIRWIGISSTLASILIVITVVSALTDPVAFALGSGRVPMFLATICFMVAFTVAIVRHQMMHIDHLISRNMLYYVASIGLTGIISLMIALSILVPNWLNLSLTTQQALTIAAVLTLSVILLLWLRDLFQQMIDRQFVRDHYRLDKALEQIQQSVAKLSDPKAIAQLFLSACRDVLDVERGALYLRIDRETPFQLMALAGTGEAPSQLPLESNFLSTLKEQGSLQRVTTGSRNELSTEQALLWELDVDLVHGLDSSEDIGGVVLLGQKQHSLSFTSEDLTFLNALGRIANVAMYSAQVMDQNISRLNEELQLKLNKISEQQRQIALLQSQLVQLNDPPTRKHAHKTEFRREACQGNSPAMIRVLETARKVAASESSVLLRGESGTGKEVLAQVLHDNSPRAGKPMIRVHCASLSPSLLESELFGHVKGSFTGAHQDRQGRFEAAHGGTLFLDEIGDISLETQIKLLRVLQERCFEPVGSVQTIHVDVRLITATHQNLEHLIQEGGFREDLFYRLNVISMELPPLRERREDIAELALHFLNRTSRQMGKPVTLIEDAAFHVLENYDWPGNIRELENVIERAVVMAEGNILRLQDLPAQLETGEPRRSFNPPSRRQPEAVPALVKKNDASQQANPDEMKSGVQSSAAFPPSTIENQSSVVQGINRKPAQVEREELQAALKQCEGNKAQAARVLGMPRSTFFSKLKRHGLA